MADNMFIQPENATESWVIFKVEREIFPSIYTHRQTRLLLKVLGSKYGVATHGNEDGSKN